MWLRNFLILVLCASLSFVSAKISDKRLCADPKCEVPISEGVTTLKYSSLSGDVLTFGQNSNVVIYSKSAGSDQSLWGVQIKNKRGYAPYRMLRETRKLFSGPLEYEVSTADIIPDPPVAENVIPEAIPNANAEEAKLIRIEEHELKAEEMINNELPSADVPFKLTEAEQQMFADDPQVVLETIPNISASDVPNPNEDPKPTLASLEDGGTPIDPQVPEVEKEQEELNVIPTQKASKEALNLNENEIPISTEPGVEQEDEDEDDYLDDEEEGEDEEEEDEKELIPTNDKEAIEQQTPTQQAVETKSEETIPEIVAPAAEVPEPVEELPTPAALTQDAVVVPETGPIAVEAPEILSTNDDNNKMTEEALPTPIENQIPDEVVKSEENDLPTPPSILLGDFINSNSPPQHMQQPMAMYNYDEPHSHHDMDTEAQLENGTDNVQNNTETEPIAQDSNPPEDSAPVVNDLPKDIPQYEVYEAAEQIPVFEVKPQEVPVDDQGTYGGQEIPPMEQRIPPIAQEKLNNDFYHYQNNIPAVNENSNEQAVENNNNNNNQFDSNENNYNNQYNYIHPPPPLPPPSADVPSYPPPPAMPYHDHYHHNHQGHSHEHVPHQEPATPEVPHQTLEVDSTTNQPPEMIQDEIPILLEPEMTTQSSNADGNGEAVPVPTETVQEEQVVESEEPVETGPGFFENMLTKTKSILGSIDITSMFKSAEEPTAPNSVIVGEHVEEEDVQEEYCEKLSPDGCPSKTKSSPGISTPPSNMRHPMVSHRESTIHPPATSPPPTPIDYNAYAIKFLDTILSFTDLILCMTIVGVTLLVFIFMHLCFTRSQKENHFVGKLNHIERELMNAMKLNQILDAELAETKHKLCSIEDNSFGSNDMVIAVKRELEQSEMQRQELMEQVEGLEKELETAAEAGLELNRMVSELLSNQQGSETIISSVEGLQSQLNEQQETILAINTLLAEKSRENSELIMELSELKTRCEDEETGQSERVQELEEQVQRLEQEKEDLARESVKIKKEVEKVQSTIIQDLQSQLDSSNAKNLKFESRIEALEESLKALEGNEGSGVSKSDMAKLMSVARVKTSLLAAVKERDQIAEKLEGEVRSKATLEEQIKSTNEEVQRLRTEYNQMEKEKLESNTKLGILSSYFKEKETQLQKELSAREAECMQQQGETTSTVEKIRAMQEEIQSLKSHNESLKNEVEVQEATHKTQILSLENRAHETWLATRQTERRLEESRSEAAVLRRKLTAMSTTENGVENNTNNLINGTASSPLHMDGVGAGAGSPIMPPMPGFMPPPPFMPAPMPHGFMPPPPFEMRAPPLGRLMSPPPPPGVNPGARYSPHLMDRGGRYTPDSRYDHFSPYETETDISPPHSPMNRSHARRSSGTYNNNNNSQNTKKFGAKGRNNYSDRSDEFV